MLVNADGLQLEFSYGTASVGQAGGSVLGVVTRRFTRCTLLMHVHVSGHLGKWRYHSPVDAESINLAKGVQRGWLCRHKLFNGNGLIG